MSNSMIPYLKTDKIDIFLEKSKLTKVHQEGKDDLNIPLHAAKMEQAFKHSHQKNKKINRHRYIHRQVLMKVWTDDSKICMFFQRIK